MLTVLNALTRGTRRKPTTRKMTWNGTLIRWTVRCPSTMRMKRTLVRSLGWTMARTTTQPKTLCTSPWTPSTTWMSTMGSSQPIKMPRQSSMPCEHREASTRWWFLLMQVPLGRRVRNHGPRLQVARKARARTRGRILARARPPIPRAERVQPDMEVAARPCAFAADNQVTGHATAPSQVL